LLGEQQAVIKPLGGCFKEFDGVSGSTILGNGRVALIMDVPALVEEAIRPERRTSFAVGPFSEVRGGGVAALGINSKESSMLKNMSIEKRLAIVSA